jgi:predicted ATPase/class 3 adenylate cyclase
MGTNAIQPPTGTVTLMFTDIVGSTALRDALVLAHGESDGDRRYRAEILDPHNERIRGLLETHRGFEVKTNGDSFMVAFAQAEDAVVCAAEIQRSLRDVPIVTDCGPLAVRIGMHTGAAGYNEEKRDYDGHSVNIAARVEGLLKGGERIYCSRETAALAKTPPGIRFHNYGPYVLKGLSGTVDIVEVLWAESVVPEPPRQQEGLPYPWLTQWIGRERETAALAEALRQNKLVTLHGPGGVGKTRIAVETLLAQGGGLPRELVFVSLENAGGLLAAVRDALGLTETDAPDFPRLCRQLRGGDRLLILDNFESVIADAGHVSSVAATPGVRVLVTSQRILDVNGEHVVRLEPMAAEESARLFTGLARQRDANWQPNDDEAMREIIAATDGLPYLIELVAAVAHKRTLRQLADELKTRLREVRARTHDSARKPQHESVEACLDWALGRLPSEERSAIARLAIFAGGFDAETANEIAETPLASLDVLVDASLLRFDRGRGRYSMLSTTRQYAQAILALDEASRLNESHARWFIKRLDRADYALRAKGGEGQREARRWIDMEFENVRQAVAWAEENDPALYGVAAEAFQLYLRQIGRFSENVRLQEEKLRRLDPGSSAELWAMTQNNLGVAYRDLPTGDRAENVAKAIACFEAALGVSTERDFPLDWAMTQNNLGNAIRHLPIGDRGEKLAKAIACYEAALRVLTERDYPVEWATIQNNLGIAYRHLLTGDRGENLAKAIAHYEAALQVRTEHDFPLDWAMTQNNLGIVYRNLPTGDRGENIAKAIAYYEAALRVMTERDFPVAWAMTQNNLGAAYCDLSKGDPGTNLEKAIAYYEAALRVWTEQAFPVDWAETQENSGIAYGRLPTRNRAENVAKAIACYEAAARGYLAGGLTQEAEKVRQRAAALAKDSTATGAVR